MKIYRNENTDPYFNLASEQYLLDTEDEPVFMLWRNERSVIIGRNQNAYAETDRSFVDDNDIAVVRRLTGGGAVFHDLGNVNFTFIIPKSDCPSLDFSRFCTPVADALKKLGVPAEVSGRNDLTVNGRKFSGNAQCVYNGKVMHHGTLLFSADVSYMSGALHVDPDKMKSNGVKSVRSRVCNLAEFLPSMTVLQLKEYLQNSFEGERVRFSDEQIKGIEKLKEEKYATWEWNYGVSKAYGKSVKRRFPFGVVELSYDSDHGVLTDVSIRGDYFGAAPVQELENRLAGTRLTRSELLAALCDAGEYVHGATASDMADLFEI